MHNFMMGPAIDVTVNRNYIYQDAFDQLTEDKGKTKNMNLQTSTGSVDLRYLFY